MKTETITIRVDPAMNRLLEQAAQESGRSRSEIAREALQRRLRVMAFERSRRDLLPLAEAAGILTDEDVFRTIS